MFQLKVPRLRKYLQWYIMILHRTKLESFSALDRVTRAFLLPCVLERGRGDIEGAIVGIDESSPFVGDGMVNRHALDAFECFYVGFDLLPIEDYVHIHYFLLTSDQTLGVPFAFEFIWRKYGLGFDFGSKVMLQLDLFVAIKSVYALLN